MKVTVRHLLYYLFDHTNKNSVCVMSEWEYLSGEKWLVESYCTDVLIKDIVHVFRKGCGWMGKNVDHFFSSQSLYFKTCMLTFTYGSVPSSLSWNNNINLGKGVSIFVSLTLGTLRQSSRWRLCVQIRLRVSFVTVWMTDIDKHSITVWPISFNGATWRGQLWIDIWSTFDQHLVNIWPISVNFRSTSVNIC